MRLEFRLPLYHPLSRAVAEDIVSGIRYPGISYQIMDDKTLRITMSVVDSAHGFQTGVTATYKDYSHISEKGFVKWVWQCTQNLILHEAAEWFSYNGTKPFYPHERK